MSITKEQQQALDDALVPLEQRLMIGSCNYRLRTTFKPKEPTFQVALDVLSLTLFYLAFFITASVPAIYMHEFWTTASYHKHSIRFKLNTKSYSFDLDTFRNMLQMCPKLHGQNGKVTGIDTLHLSRAQILWGLYHQKKVDYVYLLWEDLVFQIENKESRKTKYMFYPRFTKVIINHFMSQDQSIPKRNKVDWHMANDDPILTTMRFIPQHEVVQKYGAIFPDNLTTQAMKESEAYKTYYAFATGKAIPKPKYVRRSTKEKPEQAPKASSGKRLKAIAKVTKSGKKKQHAKGLETIFEIAFSEAKQMKLAIERSKTQLHSSQPSGSGTHEGTSITPGVPDVPIYGSDEEQISWESSDEEDDPEEANKQRKKEKDEDDNDQDDDERTESDNDGDDFVHPKLSTYDDEARNDDEVNEEESNDESNDEINDEINEESDEEVQGANTKEEEMDEEATHEEDEANELYKDVNVNLEGRDTVMTDAPLPNVQATQETEDTHVILTALINPEGQQQSSSVSSDFVSNMLNLTSVSTIPGIVDAYLANKMHEAVKTVVQLQSERLRDEAQAENEDFLNKLDDNIKKIIKDQVKEQVKAQVSKILPKIKKTVNEQLEAEVMTHSSTESKTSLAIAANLSELQLKKILIDKMESNKSINRSDEQKNLYKAMSTERSKSLQKSAGDSAHVKEPMHTAKDLEEPAHQEFKTGDTEDQPVDETPQPSEWFLKPTRLPSPDKGPRESFDELMDTPLDFLAFMMNRLKVDTLTPELLAGPTFELMKGTCKSLVELEYFFEEVYKATTDQLDWNNPEGHQYPHDLRKPLP
ncbi:hypothetical protein Tco_0195847 [Tanacetum coccineum]